MMAAINFILAVIVETENNRNKKSSIDAFHRIKLPVIIKIGEIIIKLQHIFIMQDIIKIKPVPDHNEPG
jgi:hypothetical protein